MIIENAEATCYQMLIQKAQMAGRSYLNAIEPLSQNMKDEDNTGPLKVPDSLADEQVLFLSDIGCFGADIANVKPGDDVPYSVQVLLVISQS
jgi:hypothetical protein